MLSVAIDRELLARADQHLGACSLCEHRCHADRVHGQHGPCKADAAARVFRHRIEYGEEIELIPSHLFYLSGCDLRCAFCIAEANAFNPRVGSELTGPFLSDAIRWGRERGAKNIQWVGGEPTIHIPAILRAMSDCDDLPPVVWKSDFYGTPAAFSLLKGIVDVYVADFKFGNDECARRLAGVDRYFSVITRNLHAAVQDSDLIVRHLLLPDHFDCCYRSVVDYMAREMAGVKFSIRSGYLPRWRAQSFSELAQPLEKHVADAARDLAAAKGLNVVD